MALLERELPLAALGDYAGQARQGAGRLVLVAGEAGVGKTTLLDQFAAGLTGARWCWGACDGLFTPRPLGAFLDIADQLDGDLAVQRTARRIQLSPLSAAAVSAMTAGSGLDAAELYRLTGGNPFYVVEALHAGPGQVPQSARDAVLARAARLGPQARDILAGPSAAG